jgi:catalase
VRRNSHELPAIFIDDPCFHRLKVYDGTHIGPHLLEDQLGREKITHFDHERIPERVVHARGTGAYGYFKVFDDRASKYTYAPVLTDLSRKTPVFVRFSTVQGSRGSAVRSFNLVEPLLRSLDDVSCR